MCSFRSVIHWYHQVYSSSNVIELYIENEIYLYFLYINVFALNTYITYSFKCNICCRKLKCRKKYNEEYKDPWSPLYIFLGLFLDSLFCSIYLLNFNVAYTMVFLFSFIIWFNICGSRTLYTYPLFLLIIFLVAVLFFLTSFWTFHQIQPPRIQNRIIINSVVNVNIKLMKISNF